MASFNLTANINARLNTSNIRAIANQLRNQLSVTAKVNVALANNTSANVSVLTRSLKTLNQELVGISKNSKDAEQALRSLGNAFQNINTQLSSNLKAQQTLNNTANAAKNASTQMEQFGRQAGLAFRRFAGFTIATGAIAGLIRSISSATREAVSFQRELVRISQVTGKSLGSLKSLTNEITRLSTSLGVSSAELLEISVILAQAGLSANDTQKALEALAKSSLAPTFTDIKETTEGAVAIMAQFGLQAKDLEKALGSVNAVSAAFAVESDDIIAAVKRAGGAFASTSAGVSEGADALNEFVAIFTSVRATTRESAETIATGLRTIFTRIQRPATIQFLQELGINLQDVEGKFVGPFEAVTRLSNALSRLDTRDPQFARIVEELGGFRQVGKVIPLLAQQETRLKALQVAQQGYNSLTKDAQTAQEAWSVQLAKVREEFVALIREISETSTFKSFLQILIDVTRQFIQIADAMKPILPLIAAIGAFKGASALAQFSRGLFGKGGIRFHDGGYVGRQRFASGGDVRVRGLVPGGKGMKDDYPATLQEGEFVIRRKAVDAIGKENLDMMNKTGRIGFAKGGKVYGPYSLLLSSLDEKDKQTLDNTAEPGIVQALTTASSKIFPGLNIDPNKAELVFKKSNYRGIMGSLFEAILTLTNNDPTFDPKQDENRPFDFTNGFGGPLGEKFEAVKNLKYIDAKYSKQAAKIASIRKKILNQAVLERKQGIAGGITTAKNNIVGAAILTPFLPSGKAGPITIGTISEEEIQTKMGGIGKPKKTTVPNISKKPTYTSEQASAFNSAVDKKDFTIANSIYRSIYGRNLKRNQFGVTRLNKGGQVPALLTRGEYVINRNAARSIGYGNLEQLNYADKYNKGGIVRQRFFRGSRVFRRKPKPQTGNFATRADIDAAYSLGNALPQVSARRRSQVEQAARDVLTPRDSFGNIIPTATDSALSSASYQRSQTSSVVPLTRTSLEMEQLNQLAGPAPKTSYKPLENMNLDFTDAGLGLSQLKDSVEEVIDAEKELTKTRQETTKITSENTAKEKEQVKERTKFQKNFPTVSRLNDKIGNSRVGKFVGNNAGLLATGGFLLSSQLSQSEDPNTRAAGSAIGGAIAGASIGSSLGPAGAAAGALIGGVQGALSSLAQSRLDEQIARSTGLVNKSLESLGEAISEFEKTGNIQKLNEEFRGLGGAFQSVADATLAQKVGDEVVTAEQRNEARKSIAKVGVLESAKYTYDPRKTDTSLEIAAGGIVPGYLAQYFKAPEEFVSKESVLAGERRRQRVDLEIGQNQAATFAAAGEASSVVLEKGLRSGKDYNDIINSLTQEQQIALALKEGGLAEREALGGANTVEDQASIARSQLKSNTELSEGLKRRIDEEKRLAAVMTNSTIKLNDFKDRLADLSAGITRASDAGSDFVKRNQALLGNGIVTQSRTNIFENPRAYSNRELQREAGNVVRGLGGTEANPLARDLFSGLASANDLVTRLPAELAKISAKGLEGNVQAVEIEKTINEQFAGIPKQIREKLTASIQEQTGGANRQGVSLGSLASDGARQLAEQVVKDMTEVGKKYVDAQNKAIAEYEQAVGQWIDLQKKSNSEYDSAVQRDIENRNQITGLDRSLTFDEMTEGFRTQQLTQAARSGAGGSDLQSILNRLSVLDQQRQQINQQVAQQTAAGGAPSRALAEEQGRIAYQTSAAEDVLKQIANNTSITAAATQKLQEIENKKQAAASTLERAATGDPRAQQEFLRNQARASAALNGQNFQGQDLGSALQGIRDRGAILGLDPQEIERQTREILSRNSFVSTAIASTGSQLSARETLVERPEERQLRGVLQQNRDQQFIAGNAVSERSQNVAQEVMNNAASRFESIQKSLGEQLERAAADLFMAGSSIPSSVEVGGTVSVNVNLNGATVIAGMEKSLRQYVNAQISAAMGRNLDPQQLAESGYGQNQEFDGRYIG